jgi:hypothetical protein
MYGYVRPLKSELKVREFELYRAVYCGLCHRLGKRFGLTARCTVSYDMTFLCMLLETDGVYPELERRRCPAHPFRKRCAACRMSAGDHAAAVTVLLFGHKLRDTVADEGFFKRLAARIGLLFLRRPMRRAARMLPDLSGRIAACLSRLSELEKSGEKSLDRAADCFGEITAAAGTSFPGRENDEALRALLYQTGRAVYLADALEDLEKDVKARRYNPVEAHYGVHTRQELLDAADRVRTAIDLTLSAAAERLLDLPETPYMPIIRNILLLGLPDAAERALRGEPYNGKEFKNDRSL